MRITTDHVYSHMQHSCSYLVWPVVIIHYYWLDFSSWLDLQFDLHLGIHLHLGLDLDSIMYTHAKSYAHSYGMLQRTGYVLYEL